VPWVARDRRARHEGVLVERPGGVSRCHAHGELTDA
jgi:hypothetical protein